MCPYTNLKLVITVFMFIFNNGTAQNVNISDPKAENHKLTELGSKAYQKGNYAKSLEYFTKAEAIAVKHGLRNELCTAKNNIGNIYSIYSNYGEAIGNYKEALALAQVTLDSKRKIPQILNNIGFVYHTELDYNTAIKYYLQGFVIAKDDEKVPLALNIADAYNKNGNYMLARKYLEEVKNLPKSDVYQKGWETNYAESLFIGGQTKEARILAERIFNNIDPSYMEFYPQLIVLLSNIYEIENKPTLAISYAKKGLNHTYELKDRIQLYQRLTNLYTRQQNYNTALHYKDSILLSRDSLSKSINRGLFETNKIKLRIQEYQNELDINKQKHTAERTTLVIVIFFSIVLFYFVYRNLKHRIAKQKQEKINTENEKKIFELELEGLKSNIAEKNRMLSAKALYLSGRNELIDDIVTSLSAIPEVSTKKVIADYIKTLRAYIKSDEEWDEFISYFEQVNPLFIQTLNEEYQDLNSSDIRFICYIYMNLDLREIANIFNITYNAAVKRHRRIKEKLRIDTEMSISDFLVQHVKNQ